jgi:cytochrome c-type biogenesis protein CcmH/NrfG
MYNRHSAASFEEKAEQTCEEILNEALEVDSGNAEALQAFASVRLSQQRSDEAREYLEKAWARWKDLDLGRAYC